MTRFVLYRPGVGELLKSKEMQDMLAVRARKIAKAAGEGMELEVAVGKSRAKVSVFTATRLAMIAEASNRSLTRAIDRGRG